MDFRPIAKKNNKLPSWITEYKNESGIYVFRNKNSKEILYIGESHTGRLANTLKRHLYKWKDDPERQHYTDDPDRLELAIITTTRKAAQYKQKELIEKHLPKHNRQSIPAEIQEEREEPTVLMNF